MKKVLLDTNFLTLPYQFGIDIFEKIPETAETFNLFTLSGVVEELENLAKRSGKDSKAASVALELIKKKKLEIIPSAGAVDDAIVSIADRETIVATNDRKLIKRLKNKNVEIIYLRGKNHLEMG